MTKRQRPEAANDAPPTTRQAARIAQLERQHVIDVADRAATAASFESNGLAAKHTFTRLFLKWWRGDEAY